MFSIYRVCGSHPTDMSGARSKIATYVPGLQRLVYAGEVLSGRALALTLLAWSLLQTLGKMLFTKAKPGLEQFHDNYDAEGLSVVTEREREVLQAASRCIACGRCDVGEASRIMASRGQYPGLMQLVLASTRSIPDYDAAARAFELVPDAVLSSKSCPVEVPFAELAALVRKKATERGPQPELALPESA